MRFYSFFRDSFLNNEHTEKMFKQILQNAGKQIFFIGKLFSYVASESSWGYVESFSYSFVL